MSLDPKLDGLAGEIERLQHAVQSAVATKMGFDASECTPKHLRVGVNSALIDASAVAKVLVDKGIITDAEYFTAVRDLWRAELDGYKRWFAERGMPFDFA